MSQISVENVIDALYLFLRRQDPEVKTQIDEFIKICEKCLHKNSQFINENMELYVSLLKDIYTSGISFDNKSLKDNYILKLRTNKVLSKDPDTYQSLKRIFLDETPMDDEMYRRYLHKLSYAVSLYRIDSYTRQMFSKITSASTATDEDLQKIYLNDMADICRKIIDYNQRIVSGKKEDDNLARSADFGSEESLIKVMEVYKNISIKNRLKTGLQGMNRALNGGFPLGSSIVINASTFSGKTLMLLKFARWIVSYNRLSLTVGNPTCIFYSLENETPQNVKQLFEEMWICEHHQVPPKDISDAEIVHYCMEKFNENGWKLLIERKVGSDFGFNEFVADFEAKKIAGYNPVAVIIDYVNMMKKDGNVESIGNHLQIRHLYTNLCNFLKSNNCCFITAHQLNRKATEVARLNPVGAVKKFTVDMLADSMDPQREVDIVFYQHKENDATGGTWLTWKMDKNRYDATVPEKDKYFAYKFEGVLGIIDDIGGKDKSTDNIYAASTDDEDEEEEITVANVFKK